MVRALEHACSGASTVPGATGAGVAEPLRMSEPRGRWVLLAAVLGSGIALLDATVVNVALPTIGRELDASLAGLQWTVNGYTLTLAALILLGGSLGDRYGRRRVFVIGVVWFALASLLCGLAPNIATLVAARMLQGIGGALLTPGSLAILQSTFVRTDRARAIGAWSALGGVAAAVGPFLGGWLVEAVSWRLIFLINIPLALVVVLVSVRYVPESRDPTAAPRIDITGAVVGATGLGALTAGLLSWTGARPSMMAVALLGVGVILLGGFLAVERRSTHPMLPPDVFASRQFSAANAVTFLVYGALGAFFLLVVLQLQVSAGFSAIAAGASLLPVTVLMLLLSSRMGALATRIGPRLPMSLGPAVAAAGAFVLAGTGTDVSYVTQVLPAVSLFGLGLAIIVAPLTATVLAAASDRHAGVASGVNNAVARAASLIAVAAVPLAAGLAGADYRNPTAFTDGFRIAMLLCAGLLLGGGLLAALTIRTAGPAPADE